MKKLLSILLLLTSLYSSAQNYTRDSINVPYTSSASPTTKCLIYKRTNYATNTSYKYPLLVFLHGAGEAGTNLSKIYTSSSAGGPPYFIEQGTFPANFTINGNTHEFLVIAPQRNNGWSASGQELDYIIRNVVANYRVDTTRIYVMGLSAGGAGTVEYICGLDPNETDTTVAVMWKAAAAVPHAPATNAPATKWGVKVVNDSVHVWGFGDPESDIHGERAQQLVNSINAAKASYARFTNTNAGHNFFNDQFSPSYTEVINGTSINIYQWMLQYQRGTASSGVSGGMHNLPSIDAGNHQHISLPTSSVSFTATPTLTDAATGTYQWTKLKSPSTTKFKVTVAGSSTAAGYGLSSGESFVDRMRSYYVAMGLVDSIRNIAVGGTSPWDIDFTALFVGNPNIVLINYPTNAYDASGNTPAVIAAKIQEIKDSCTNRGVQFFVTGTQPRNYDATTRIKLKTINDTLRNRFGDRFIDFFTYSADTATANKYNIYSSLDQGDGIHQNAVGHAAMFAAVKSVNIFKYSVSSTASFSAATSLSTNVSSLIQGTHLFQVGVYDSYGAYSSDTVSVIVNAAPIVSGCGGTSYTAPATGDGGYFNTYNLQPGDTLFLDANIRYSYVYIADKHGTPSCPIIVMNKNGQAKLRGDQMQIFSCSNLKVLGTGTPGVTYGINIQYHEADTIPIQGKFGIAINGLSRKIEVSNVSIRRVSIGIEVKQDPDCDSAFWYGHFIMDSIYIHDNQIIGTGNQGMYIGNTSPDNPLYDARPVVCGATTIYPQPFRLGWIRVENNYVDSTGRSGIQMSTSNNGYNYILNNTVKHNGLNGDEAQPNAILLGSYTSAEIAYNTISNTLTFGIASVGGSNTDTAIYIHHNTIDSAGYLRWYNNATSTADYYKQNTAPTYNNTITYARAIHLQTVQQQYPDSVSFTIKDNVFGKQKSSIHISLLDGYNFMQKAAGKNVICSNTSTQDASIVVNIESGYAINYSACAMIQYLKKVMKGRKRVVN